MKPIACAGVLALMAALPLAVASAEPTMLKYGTGGPPDISINTKLITPWSQDVTAASDGTLDIKIFTGPSLVNLGNSYDRVLNGVAEMAFGILGPVSSQFPRTAVITLPFKARTSDEASTALWHLYERGVLGDEFQKVKLLSVGVFARTSLHTRQPVKKLEDLAGIKLSVQSRMLGETVTRLGGTPITMPVSDLYESLQRGTIDGAAIGWPATSAYKVNELVTNHVDVPLGGEVAFMMMNKQAYEKLTGKAKAAIDKLDAMPYTKRFAATIDGDVEWSLGITRSKKQSIVTLDATEEARWRKQLEPITAQWVAATPDGAKVLQALDAELIKIRGGS